MTEITSQFSHVFIHYYSNKSALTSKLFISQPNKSQEKKLGRLFGIIEINTPGKENINIINKIISDLEETYYTDEETENDDLEKRFETTLNKVNQSFAQSLSENKSFLIGNLNEYTIKEKINLTIGLLKENFLYLSYLNKIGVYLVHKTKQDYKIIDIKKITNEEDKKNNEEEGQIKLFSNLTQGELNPPDYLFLANSSFMDFVSLERITKTITSLPVNKAAEYFKNSLLQHEEHNFAAIIIKNSIAQATQDNKMASLTSINQLNTTESSTEKLLAPNFITSLKSITKIFSSFKRADQNTGAEKQAEINNDTTQIDQEQKESIIKKHLGAIIPNLYRKIKKTSSKAIDQSPKINQGLGRLKNFLRLKIAYFGTYLKKIPGLSKILLIIAILLIIIFVYSISYFKHQQTNEADSEQFNSLITQIEEKTNSAESNLIFGDETKAFNEITEAQKLLSGLEVNSQKQRDKQEELNRAIEVIIAKLRHITTINEPTLIADLSTEQENNIDIKNIIYLDKQIIAFDSINNNTYTINPDSQQVSKIYSNLSDIGKIVKVNKIDDQILLYHDKNGFMEFKNGKFIPIEDNLPANAKIIDFATYNKRLYSLDQTANQIYRQPQIPTGYGSGNNWFTTAVNLENVTSIGIDTNIWLLDKINGVLKFNKGAQVAFTIKKLEPKLESALQLITNDETNFIYLLEPQNKRIIVLDKEGLLVTQYFSQEFDNLKNFVINEKEKKAFVVNDNKIYSFSLNHF